MGKTRRDYYNNKPEGNGWSPDYESRDSLARLTESELDDLWKGYWK